ncbi:MFS transporter, DHA1 family, bicyclomycin/chloramphenicol resistance protein [Sphingomonas gellani]|uniref:Bcr/CflA family efflux transporter n=1 Tax=Sphingomonas gellani TaxID=1166340 RepID=A0A1H8DT32_9SPHN|nr:multidrug effflux MFS transporter [Sphingomonas gellani]SEN10383.1 MFS transporter, DHA1 family, bicyclomycin/chloramphenicol resistance protein [Sphingomonas gellani]
MTSHHPHTPALARPGLHRREFVAFVASIMAVNALGVDLMLPALPAIGRDLSIESANARQWIVTAYVFGFGLGQLVYGPLADRYGRKPVLLVTLAGFVAASVFAAGSATFPALLVARVLQGVMSASTRVLSVAIIRDSYSGRQMARVSSVAQMIFFLVPILAPSIGQGLLTIGPWRFVFYALGGFAAFVFAWALWRLPETLAPERRRPISLASLSEAYRLTITNRFSIGYAVAASLTFGGIIAFVSSAQQVFTDTFHAGGRFTLLFAACAFSMGVASFANSRLVERLGTRAISQTGLIALIALSLAHLGVEWAGIESLWTYMLFQALSMTCIGLCGSNFGAMAMEPVGHIAGTASSVQGFVTSIGAVAVGSFIGQAYDGTTLPLAFGYLAIGAGGLLLVLWIEGGRLFTARMG